MSTVARRNVALVRAGTWAASTGVTKITRDDLAAMQAAYADQVVDRPVIKLGHTDDNALNAELADGEPAFGWLANVTVGDGSAERPDPDTLYGDYVGMPAKLAEVADTAWRRRSVEISWGVKTAAGKAYTAVLTGVALLGIAKPAVKGLADVLALYSSMEEAEKVTTLELVDGLNAEQVTTLAAARAEVTRLAEAYQIPAEKRDEALERLDRLAGVRDTDTIPPAVAEATEGEPTSQTTEPEKGKRMAITKADVDKALEQAGDQDVTTLLEGLLKPGEGEQTATGTTTDTGTATTTDTGSTGTTTETAPLATAATAATTSTGTQAVEGVDVVTVSKSVLTELQDAAGALAKDRRDKVVTTALSEGKITPAEEKAWRDAIDKDEAGTTSLLSAMQPRFATQEVGTDLSFDAHGGSQLSEADQKAYDDFLGPIKNL